MRAQYSLLLTNERAGVTGIRRDSIITTGDGSSRRNSLILPDYYGRSTVPVMEVEPWELTLSVQEVKQLFEVFNLKKGFAECQQYV